MPKSTSHLLYLFVPEVLCKVSMCERLRNGTRIYMLASIDIRVRWGIFWSVVQPWIG